MNRDIIICVDDFGQNNAISEAALLLAHKNKVNAISCLVNGAHWPEAHKELPKLASTHYLGLHFNLTCGHALSSAWQNHYGKPFSSLTSILKKSYFGQLNASVVEAEIGAQLDAFTDALGMFPDFIDGHQHVHQLPIIRDAWLRLYQSRPLRSFFRSTSNGWHDFLNVTQAPKRQFISLLGGMTFKRRLKTASIPTNTSFAGIYNFQHGKQYGHYFREFLNISQPGGLIMSHPGMSSTDRSDPLYQNRHHEFQYFMSAQYITDMKETSFQLKPKFKISLP